MVNRGQQPDERNPAPAYGTNEFARLNDALRDWADEGGAPAAAAAVALGRPKQVGHYRVTEVIGEGGMGSVYKAEQQRPVRRTVAVKLVKPGLDSREVLARFEAERQALARMDHPGIAKVLDAGADDLGRPYFVMEYVPGAPITRFCDEHRLPLPARLELFIQVCDAIAHAHTKAIIHRDIKGSNVLAYLQDGKPVVKVIDFGVAKALAGDRLTENTYSTERGSIIGTYDSMSPEQADGSRDIDTRADVYALGVLLYELIAGAKPFDHRTLAGAPDHEVRRIIREVEPPRPASRLPSGADGLTRVAQLRQMRPDALQRALAGELAWIPLKAMRKERERRYASPLELADDVRNYLEGRPLVAGPESRAYVVRKFVARHRAAVIVTAAVLALSVAAAAFYVYSIRAEQARTLKALRTAEEQRKIAEDRTEYAEYQSTVANNSKMFLGEMLRALNPTRSKGKVVLAVDVLRETERRVASTNTEQPAVEGQLRNELGDLYLALGQAEDALAQYSRVREIRLKLWGTDATLSIVSEGRVGEALEALGRLDEAEANFRAALERCKKYFKADHFEMLRAQTNLGRLLARTGRYEEAEPLLRTAYEQRKSMTGRDVGLNGLDTLRTGGYLGELLKHMGRAREAEAVLQDVLSRRAEAAGEDDPDVVRFQQRLAELYAESGRADEAESLFRAALVNGRKVFPESHPDLVALLRSFADHLSRQGKHDEAQTLAREAADRAAKGQPATSPAK